MTRTRLFDRTVGRITAHAQWMLRSEALPERDGFLQRVTPLTKLVGVFVLVTLTALQRDLATVTALLGLAVGLGIVSRIPIHTLAGRLAGPPGFALVVVAPQAVLIDGPALYSTPISTPGLEYAAVFTVRVAACVAFLSVLLVTTRFRVIVTALRRLGLPPIAVSLLSISYRYLRLFFAELERMVRARRSRTVTDPDLDRTWRDSGHFLGTFLIRSLERGERVQRAARARGGTGTPRMGQREPLGMADLTFGVLVSGVAVVVVL